MANESNMERYVQDMLQTISKFGLQKATENDVMDEVMGFSEVLNNVCKRYSDQAVLPVLAGRVAILMRKGNNPAMPRGW